GQRPGVETASLTTCRPERRDDLVQVGTTHTRRALDELEPIGRKYADERTRIEIRGAMDPRPVCSDDLRGRALNCDLETVLEAFVADHHHDPGSRCLEPDQLTIVRGPEGPPHA